MKSVKSIEIIFENCEYMCFESKHIGTFFMDNIKTSIARVASNCIAKMLTSETVVIELFSEGNTEYAPFGIDEDKSTKFERILAHNDITAIHITYENGDVDEIYVDYNEATEGMLGSPNVNQKTELSKLGNIYLVISKEKEIKDIFNDDEINDKETISFHKSMISE